MGIHKRLLGALVAFAWLAAAPALAVTTTTTTLSTSAYADLGAGPLALSITGDGIQYLVGDAQPAGSAAGIPLLGGLPIPVATTSHVWAKGLSSASKAVTYPISTAATGVDYSANKPTLPNVGAAFAAGGPYSSYVLVATVPANPARRAIDIENISGAQIAVVRDDGTAAGGAAPVNASVFALAGGAAVGAQGGSWSTTTFLGRLQIYAASSTAQVAVMGD